jgi:mannose-6-phosphate isomerase-like protein (cupin superfamily)
MKQEFNINEYIEKIKHTDIYFHTFINKESLAAGVLVLQPGERDTQEPHESDELYFILKGDGFLKIKDTDYTVSENKMYFVGKNTEHFFHGNSKELVVLYFFGGPDS